MLNLKGHKSKIQALVFDIGKTDILLGYDWLAYHNPEINWITGEVLFIRCSSHCQIYIKTVKMDQLLKYLIPYKDRFKEKDFEALLQYRPWKLEKSFLCDIPLTVKYTSKLSK